MARPALCCPRWLCRPRWYYRSQVCSTVCNNHDESCVGWAKANECETNKAFMYRVCPASCGICQILETTDKVRAHPNPNPDPNPNHFCRLATGTGLFSP